MQRYRCHKEVSAFKIERIVVEAKALAGGARLYGYKSAVEVTSSFMQKHKPEAGGYYVLYEDGYESFSPAEAFESGYTKI